jgi:hypothetical protein
MEIGKIIRNMNGTINPKSNELKPFNKILREDLTSISAPRNYPIIPERFNSTSKPCDYSIVPEYLISITRIV